MVDAGGTRTCVHPHVSRLLYHCATDADDNHVEGNSRQNVWIAQYRTVLAVQPGLQSKHMPNTEHSILCVIPEYI